MGLVRDLTPVGRGPPVIYLTTLSDPNPLASTGKSLKSTTSSNDQLSPLSSFPNNNSDSNNSSISSAKTFQRHQHYQHDQQQHQPSSSSPSMPQQEDIVIDPSQAQGGKKKKKKKKKKVIASTDPSLAPDESITPPATLPTINEQEEMLNKEALDWFEGTVVQSDTKSAGKKFKEKKKATTEVATAEASAEVATEYLVEQAGFEASQAHFDDKRKDVAQAPVNVGVNVEPSHSVYDIHGRQVLYAVAASGNNDLDFLNDDFMNTATSNWADDIDEYEQKHIPPISIATAAPPATSTTTLSTSAQQAACKDSAPTTLVYKGPVVTQDARFSSAPDTRRSHGQCQAGPRPFKARPGRDFSERHSDYHQPRPPREYPARPFDYRRRTYGEYSARPNDYHLRPPASHQPGMPHRPLMSEPPVHSHQRPMSGRPLSQHQTYYPGRPQGQQSHFQRSMHSPRPQSASQQQHYQQQEPQQQHQQQHQRPLASPDPDFGPIQAQTSWKQSKADSDANNLWQSTITTKPKNAWHSSTKPALVSRRGSHEDQGPVESPHKPEVERNKSVTTSATLVAPLQISGEPEDMRAPGPGMDTTTSPKPSSHASQKNKHKKQEQRCRFSLSTQSQEEPQLLMSTQLESQAHVEPLDQQLQEDSGWEQLQHVQQLLIYDELPSFEDVKDFELPWLTSSKVKTGPEPWADRNKMVEFFSKRWVEARMSSGGHGLDAAVVYCSPP